MSEYHAAESDIFQFFNEIGIINQLATTRLERVLPLGIRSSQFGILNHLIRVGDGRTHQQLTNSFEVTKGAMTNNLNRLLEKRLITMVPDDQDGRVKRYYLTDLGRKVRDEAIAKISEDFQLLLRASNPAAFTQALPLLQTIRKLLDSHRVT